MNPQISFPIFIQNYGHIILKIVHEEKMTSEFYARFWNSPLWNLEFSLLESI